MDNNKKVHKRRKWMKLLFSIWKKWFSNKVTQNTFTAFMATVEKILTYMVGGHNPGSAQAGRTSMEMKSVQSPDINWVAHSQCTKLKISEN